ncbi:rRNA cytosine-C5-methyltransferase [Bacterioplanes sanyensis]|uniref:rRNA cytosine-C5-methyltransferase n=1 Tax=Bacterioplanes sanyensis TaxID=1249553 RepID=A0A222FLH2_9GAMM|nr:RsmB/NOP family class I SAM-dependent RNA methyltransferase [Bacterioplanes sanyensis]ASP39630.1 rRNA cytosine-C5-methyltransferase [Bacterioplanes sanyensis]
MRMLPTDFAERFERLCPPQWHLEAQRSFDQPRAVTFRVNTLRPGHEHVIDRLQAQGLDVAPVAWSQELGLHAWQVAAEQREALTYSHEAEVGDIYIQSLSSMLAPWLLQPKVDDWVLDLAAAPGGKTILLAQMMKNQGRISAVEPVKNRFFRLRANLERMGIENTQCYMKDGRAIGTLKPDTFDRIMLDAPCSSESRFKSYDASSTEHWSLRKVSECAKKQKRLIQSAFDALKPGGVMMYCTCSFSPEENEAVVSQLLKKRPAQLLPMALPEDIANASPGLVSWLGKDFHPDCDQTLRIWPQGQMDGFYLALIRKPL